MPDRVSVTYWSDPLCIWAFAAQPRLLAVQSRWSGCLDVSHRMIPVFGSVPWRLTHGDWAEEGAAGRAAACRRIAADHGRDDVSGEVWTTDPPTSSWSSGAAVKAAQALEAAGQAPPGAAADFLWRLRCAFFVQDLNTTRRPVQCAVARACGLPQDAFLAALDDGSALAALAEDQQERERLRVQGSPCWVFDGGRAQLYGNFAEGVLHAAIEALIDGRGPGASACR